MKYLIVVMALILATSGYAAEESSARTDSERLMRVREEVRARSMLHRYQKGEVTLSSEELQRYREIVAVGRERRIKEKLEGQGQPRAPYTIRTKDMPLAEFARMLQRLYEVPVSVTDELSRRRVSVAISADTRDEFVSRLELDLAKMGLELVPHDDQLRIQAMVPSDQKG